jgi:fatty-acyl-CoA synthase
MQLNNDVNQFSLRYSHWESDTSMPVLESTVGSALCAAARTFGERTALIDGDVQNRIRRTWSFVRLYECAKLVASALLDHFVPGEHIAGWGNNSPRMVNA